MWLLWFACAARPVAPITAPPPVAWTEADARAAIAARWDKPVVEVSPFLITAEDPRDAARAVELVTWAQTALRRRHFEKEPADAWTIWLFRGDDSFRAHADVFFGDEPDTPYGYAAHHDLVMNIGTGGGTLVHELVHPYVHANAPEPPPWINEGLASLYEATTDDHGRIVPIVNWRLPGLVEALDGGRAPTIAQVAAMSPDDFYDEGTGGLNYAVARYTMLWLHDHDRLDLFWRGWLAARAEDPTGARTLARVVGGDLQAFERNTWRPWVWDFDT